jgi:hypothetical protein
METDLRIFLDAGTDYVLKKPVSEIDLKQILQSYLLHKLNRNA